MDLTGRSAGEFSGLREKKGALKLQFQYALLLSCLFFSFLNPKTEKNQPAMFLDAPRPVVTDAGVWPCSFMWNMCAVFCNIIERGN